MSQDEVLEEVAGGDREKAEGVETRSWELNPSVAFKPPPLVRHSYETPSLKPKILNRNPGLQPADTLPDGSGSRVAMFSMRPEQGELDLQVWSCFASFLRLLWV